MNDLIDRQDAINAMYRLEAEDIETYGCSIPEGFDSKPAIEALRALPSAEPERKKGEWIKDEHTYSGPNTYNYVCSACGAIGGSWLRDLPKNLMYPFCPFCGADMRGE